LDTFTSILKSPLQLLSPAKAAPEPVLDEEDEEDDIDAYLAWEEEVWTDPLPPTLYIPH